MKVFLSLAVAAMMLVATCAQTYEEDLDTDTEIHFRVKNTNKCLSLLAIGNMAFRELYKPGPFALLPCYDTHTEYDTSYGRQTFYLELGFLRYHHKTLLSALRVEDNGDINIGHFHDPPVPESEKWEFRDEHLIHGGKCLSSSEGSPGLSFRDCSAGEAVAFETFHSVPANFLSTETEFLSKGVLDVDTEEKLLATENEELCLSPGFDFRTNDAIMEPCGQRLQSFWYDPRKEILQTFAVGTDEDGVAWKASVCLAGRTDSRDTAKVTFVACECHLGEDAGLSLGTKCDRVRNGYQYWVSDDQGHIMWDDPHGARKEYCLSFGEDAEDGRKVKLGACDSPEAIVFALAEPPVPSQSPTLAPTTRVPSQAPSVSPAPTESPTTLTPTLSPSTLEPTTHMPTEHPAIVHNPDYEEIDMSHATAEKSTNVEWTRGSPDPMVTIDGSHADSIGYKTPPGGCNAEKGFIMVDLKTPTDVDGLRIYLAADMDAHKLCTPVAIAAEKEIVTTTTTTTKPMTTTTRQSTTTRPHALTRPGSMCLVCGDLDGQVPCSDWDLVLADQTKCPDTQPYCMNDIIQHGRQVDQYRRCVNETVCDNLWYQATSDEPLCLHFDPSSPADSLTCHLCCYGDGCNIDANPPDNTLYRPGRRQLADTTAAAGDDTLNLLEDAVLDHGGVLEVHFNTTRTVRYINVGIGSNTAGDPVDIVEIMPLRKATPSASPSQAPSLAPSQSPSSSPTKETDTPTSSPSSSPTSEVIENEDIDFSLEIGETEGWDVPQTASPTKMKEGWDVPGEAWDVPQTASPTNAKPTDKDLKKASSSGDPHFKTFGGDKFDFHGGCDLVLFQNDAFYNGLGLRAHIRTKITDWWSYIETAAIQIGDETLEVTGGSDGGKYWVNGQLAQDLTNDASFTVAGFEVKFHRITNHQIQLRISFGRNGAMALRTFKDWVEVNVSFQGKEFNGSLGMMGSYPSGTKLARDGKTVMGNTDEFGKEWQVLATEPLLFTMEGSIQHPHECAMPNTSLETKRQLRRRLGESVITQQDAELACARVAKDDHDSCIYDVLATNDKGMAGAY